MPHSYITKLIFDSKHANVIAKRNNEVVGGACFRCFSGKNFAELVFLGVDQTARASGIGSRIIEHLKCKSFLLLRNSARAKGRFASNLRRLFCDWIFQETRFRGYFRDNEQRMEWLHKGIRGRSSDVVPSEP